MRKVRVNVTVDYDDKTTVGSVKSKDKKKDITDELSNFTNDVFSEMNPQDIKIRFLRK